MIHTRLIATLLLFWLFIVTFTLCEELFVTHAKIGYPSEDSYYSYSYFSVASGDSKFTFLAGKATGDRIDLGRDLDGADMIIDASSLSLTTQEYSFIACLSEDEKKVIWTKLISMVDSQMFNNQFQVTGMTMDDDSLSLLVSGSFHYNFTLDDTMFGQSHTHNGFVMKMKVEDGSVMWFDSLYSSLSSGYLQVSQLVLDTKRDSSMILIGDVRGYVMWHGNDEQLSDVTQKEDTFAMFILRIDREGKILDYLVYHSDYLVSAASLVIDDSSNAFYLVGSFIDELSLTGVTQHSYGSKDIFLASFQFINDKLSWYKFITGGSASDDDVRGVVLLEGKLFLTGYVTDEAFFDPISFGKPDEMTTFVLEAPADLNSFGHETIARADGSISPQSMVADTDGHSFYITGQVKSNGDYMGVPIKDVNSGKPMIYVAKHILGQPPVVRLISGEFDFGVTLGLSINPVSRIVKVFGTLGDHGAKLEEQRGDQQRGKKLFFGTIRNSFSCYSIDREEQGVCSGFGQCVKEDTCNCPSGYAQPQCIPTCSGVIASSYSVCSSHGRCVAHNQCSCNTGYAGGTCEVVTCSHPSIPLPSVCDGHGSCVNDQCKCQSGYHGYNCTVTECFSLLANDSSVCSSQGKCISPDFCRCNSGYDGKKCEIRLSIDIKINLNDAGFFVRSNSLQATAYFQPIELASSYRLSWDIKDKSGHVLNIDEILNDRVTSTMRTISFRPNSFSPGEQYELSVYFDNSSVMGRTIYNSISKTMRFTVSSPPVGGVLTVSSTSGVVMTDKLSLNTDGWTANDNSKYILYRFGYRRNGIDTMLNSFSSVPSLSVVMPVTGSLQLFAHAKAESGDTATSNFVSVNVTKQVSAELNELILTQVETLITVNSTVLSSQSGVVTAYVVESASTMNQTQTTNIVSSIIDVIKVRSDAIPKEQQIELISTLSGLSQYFSQQTSITTSGILSGLLDEHVGDQSILDQAVTAVKNIVPVMTNSNSSTNQIESASLLIDSVTRRLRENLLEGESLQLSIETVEIVAIRINRTEDLVVDLDVTVPNTGQSEKVVVNLSTSPILDNLQDDASFYAQGEIYQSPPQHYSSLCNTKLVSPVIAVRVFSENSGELFDQYSTPVVTSSMGVNENLNQGNTSFIYVCKFFDNNTRTWQNDTSVCSTGISSTNSGMTLPNGKRVVTCSCTKPVAHAVSLDYVQSDSGDAVSDDGAVACTNPCGCGDTQTKKQTGLPVWAIVLIVLACLSVLVLLVLCLLLGSMVGYKVVQRKANQVKLSDAELSA